MICNTYKERISSKHGAGQQRKEGGYHMELLINVHGLACSYWEAIYIRTSITKVI